MNFRFRSQVALRSESGRKWQFFVLLVIQTFMAGLLGVLSKNTRRECALSPGQLVAPCTFDVAADSNRCECAHIIYFGL